jgi:hypothetical protein
MTDKEISLREYIDLRFNQNQLAIDKAEKLMSERLNSMNEFRATLKDQAGTFITRSEHEILNLRTEEEIRTLNTAKDIASGKASQNSVNFAYILAAMGILISMIDLVLRLIGH